MELDREDGSEAQPRVRSGPELSHLPRALSRCGALAPWGETTAAGQHPAAREAAPWHVACGRVRRALHCNALDWMQAVDSKLEKMTQSRLDSQAFARGADTASIAAAALGKVLAVSPHLDDAVLGCGDLLALNPGACVLTVFAGAPRDADLTHWDRLAGFRHPAEVIPIRKEEDALALLLLDAYPLWLDFLDAQYEPRPPLQEVTDALRTAIAQRAPDHVLFPLGLFHDDHRLTSEAMLRVCRTLPQAQRPIVYADALYRELPGEVERRVQGLRADGCLLAPLAPAPQQAAKRRAVECYESQLRALATPGHIAIERAFCSEAYWTLAWDA